MQVSKCLYFYFQLIFFFVRSFFRFEGCPIFVQLSIARRRRTSSSSASTELKAGRVGPSSVDACAGGCCCCITVIIDGGGGGGGAKGGGIFGPDPGRNICCWGGAWNPGGGALGNAFGNGMGGPPKVDCGGMML